MRTRKLICSIVVSLAAGCVGAAPPPDDAIAIGALLPYTGTVPSPTGFESERAILMAIEDINAAGGVGGRPLRLAARDGGHPAAPVVVARAHELIDGEEIVALLGPEVPEAITEIAGTIAERRLPTLTGAVHLPRYEAHVGGGYFRSVAPNAGSLGILLASHIRAQGTQHAVIAHQSDSYGVSMLAAIRNSLSSADPPIEVTAVAIDSSQPRLGFTAEPTIRAGTADALVLIAFPELGAEFVREWGHLDTLRWYLAPPLRSAEFLNNLPSGISLAMSGVGPALPDDADLFAARFEARWAEREPTIETYYYYDAVVLLALAMEASVRELGEIDGRFVRDQIPAVASTHTGRWVGWYEIARALELVRAGVPINYRGASGAHDIEDGRPRAGLATVWAISGGRFVDLGLVH